MFIHFDLRQLHLTGQQTRKEEDSMKRESFLKCVMIVQQLDPEYWIGWEPKLIEEANKGNLQPMLKELLNRFENSGTEVSDLHGIIHDKDELIIWDSKKLENVTVLKEKHVHILVKFTKGNTITSLAEKAGVSAQYIERAKSGRYGHENMLAYLVHAKDEEKHQYSAEEVVTITGENYTSIYNRSMKNWMRGRATKQANNTKLSVDFIVSEILKGKITKSNLLLTSEYYKVYALHKRKLNDALDAYAERKAYKTIDSLENGNFKKTVVFIEGPSGSGKTLTSKKIIQAIQQEALSQEGSHWDFCMTAAKNPFDEYNAQEVLFLDDIRSQSLNVTDWLKLLDPYTMSPISARYNNKLAVAKVIIITSTLSPLDFFASALDNTKEDLGQFFRRVDLRVSIDNDIFTLATHEPTNKKVNIKSNYIASLNDYSYSFKELCSVSHDEAVSKILDVVAKNMNWDSQDSLSEQLQDTPKDPVTE